MIPIAKPAIGAEEEKAVLEVLNSGMLAQGERVKQFEEKFAGYVETKYAVATNNGTAALHTALLAAGIESCDEVITTPFSFIATANAILYCGAKPVFADIDEKTFNIGAEEIKEKLTGKTKALLLVHLYGQTCEMSALSEICEDHKLKLIEDACQAHGAEYRKKKAGSFGDCAAFSFYPTKNMTTGEGGMVATNDRKIAEKARAIRDHGSSRKYHHEILGYNYRMTEIAAAMGIEQLKKIDALNQKRIRNAQVLTKGIQKIRGLVLPYILPDVKHVFNQYTIRVTKEFCLSRDELAGELNEKGIKAGVYYPLPIHRQVLYRRLGYKEKLPEAEKASKEVLSLPVHPSVSEKELQFIISSIGAIKVD